MNIYVKNMQIYFHIIYWAYTDYTFLSASLFYYIKKKSIYYCHVTTEEVLNK